MAEDSCREPLPQSDAAARMAGLVISSDCRPGIRRERSASGFTYRRDDGGELTETQLERIEALTIPPAWEDVWICANESGHLQATGRDSRGRKQYRYHERWRVVRDETKFEHLISFGEALPRIRERVDRDLRRPRLDRERVLALAVAVLDRTLIRVGNPEYARENDSYGLTTLRSEHAEVGATTVRLRFRGKAGKQLSDRIDDPRIARALRRMRDLPGQELFQYVDEAGETRLVESGDVNGYLHEVSGVSLTSKDFRTWGGSLAFARAMAAETGGPTHRVVEAVKAAAETLGNTPAVSRRAYIHPALIEAALDARFDELWQEASAHAKASPYLSEDEAAFLGMLRLL